MKKTKNKQKQKHSGRNKRKKKYTKHDKNATKHFSRTCHTNANLYNQNFRLNDRDNLAEINGMVIDIHLTQMKEG